MLARAQACLRLRTLVLSRLSSPSGSEPHDRVNQYFAHITPDAVPSAQHVNQSFAPITPDAVPLAQLQALLLRQQ
jgi:hypothetical protein